MTTNSAPVKSCLPCVVYSIYIRSMLSKIKVHNYHTPKLTQKGGNAHALVQYKQNIELTTELYCTKHDMYT
jgi:hypothetical protein